MSKLNTYYGKYRGSVVNNVDPLGQGRLLLLVTDVYGLATSPWAMPCLPFTGKQMGMWALPQINAGVWVEFEQGDPQRPIWTGCWYGPGEAPAVASATSPPLSNFVVQTASQHQFVISDNPGPAGGILLKTASGAMISITDLGITISNGQGAEIKLLGSVVDINGVLTVLK